jgi:hypothetical protein
MVSTHWSCGEQSDQRCALAVLQGFLQNISFLRVVFNPTYTILDIREYSGTELLARWTMGFDVLFIQKSSLGRFWWPRLEFTGTTLYGINKSSGLIERHLDTWDSIEKQEYFSLEGFVHMLSQIFTPRAPPKFQGPAFSLLKCAILACSTLQCVDHPILGM